MRQRLTKIIQSYLIIFSAGLLYYIVNILFNIKIPCIFNKITGLYCPGCGISRMFISLFSGEIKTAFGYNPAVFISLPLIIAFLTHASYKYVKHGTQKFTGTQTIIIWLFTAYLIIFGILRNLPQFSFLAP